MLIPTQDAKKKKHKAIEAFFTMELQLFGINHKTSSVSDRENFIINESNQILLDNNLKSIFGSNLDSIFAISTCNRTEVYMYADKNMSKKVFGKIFNILNIDKIPKNKFYFLNDHDALVHMCKVASGIDSQVLGEQEIFGQFKQALRNAQNMKILKGKLQLISNKVIEISKKARTETEIGLNSISISGLAIKLVNNIFENPHQQNVLVIGAGYMGINLMQNLYKRGIKKIRVVNRTIKKINITNEYEIISASLEKLHNELENADIVIASSITELPLVGKGAVENALSKRFNKPMLIIDLGVPRNIEEEIRTIEKAYLFTIDDIEKITQDNFGQRSIEADKAMKIIVLDAKTAIDSINKKSKVDKLNIQLKEFLNNLSQDEIEQFKKTNDYSELVLSIKTMNIKNTNFDDFKDLKNVEGHVIESMIKRFFDNA